MLFKNLWPELRLVLLDISALGVTHSSGVLGLTPVAHMACVIQTVEARHIRQDVDLFSNADKYRRIVAPLPNKLTLPQWCQCVLPLKIFYSQN